MIRIVITAIPVSINPATLIDQVVKVWKTLQYFRNKLRYGKRLIQLVRVRANEYI